MTGTIDKTVNTGSYETYLNRAGEGNGEKVLFLHGSGPGATAWSNWQFALPALGENFDCLAPDLIGYGKSQHPEDPPRDASAWLQTWLGQIESLLDELGLDKVHVVGNSMGGALALHLMNRHPERIGKAVLMGTMGVPFEITRELNDLWGFYDDPSPERMAEVIGWFVYDPDVVGGDLQAIADDRYGAATREEISYSFASMFPITRQGTVRQGSVDALALDDAAIERLEHETLLVHGRDDVIIPLQTSLDLLQKLQRPQLHVFGRCRHWIMIEYAAAFNGLLSDFLNGYEA
jgi:2-hydroxymuconate-semialdehyde hydrolase